MRDSKDKNGKTKLILTVGAPAYGGFTLARLPQAPGANEKTHSKVVLVRGAIPGETIEAVIDDEKKDYYLASTTKIIEPSPDRIAPPCPYFGTCGGCQLQYASYKREVEMKEAVLADTLRRIGQVDVEPAKPLILEDNALGYRYRAQLKVSGSNLGFFKEKSREVIDIERCPLMLDELNEGLAKIRAALQQEPSLLEGIAEIYIAFGDGLFASVRLQAGLSLKKGDSDNFIDKLSSLFLGCDFDGVVLESVADKSKSHRGEVEYRAFGKKRLSLPLHGLDYAVSAGGFFQGNWRLNQDMAALVKDNLPTKRGARVLDLYAGAGNFALPVALSAGMVLAVEENAAAVADGLHNLAVNGINNVRFLQSAVERLDMLGVGPIDSVIVDPPRNGLSDMLIANLLTIHPGTIAYVSCNPSTLARDLKKLANGYHIESVRLVDLFPQTYHLEAVAFLLRL